MLLYIENIKGYSDFKEEKDMSRKTGYLELSHQRQQKKIPIIIELNGMII